MSANLKEGDLAPAFELPTGEGGMVSLATMRGAPLVLYFYPKDDTSGCTKQAIAFTQAKTRFDRIGVNVIGVSADSADSHAKFAKKHKLTIALAADPERKTVSDYGVWVEKSMYGRKYMGIERSTFLIDGDGRIARIWRKVKVPGHVEEVLKAAQNL